MAGRERRVISIQPRPDFTPTVRHNAASVQLTIQPRTMHAREMIKRTGSTAIIIKKPECCPLCKSEGRFVSEIEKDGQWWWSCSECGNEWEPVRKTI